jgi:hypothetical protein
MRVLLDGLPLETVEYFEGREIGFTCFTADDGFGLALCEALGAKDVLELQRGEENTLVRVHEHEVTPPYARRCGGAVHRHTVRLERVDPVARAVPTAADRIPSALAAR